MNENYLILSVLGAVLLTGIIGIYYTMNEPGLTGFATAIGYNNFNFAPTAYFFAIQDTVACSYSAPTSLIPSIFDSTTTIVAGVYTPTAPPNVLGGPITSVKSNLEGYATANTGCGTGDAQMLLFEYNGLIGATLTVSAPGIPPVFDNVALYVRDYSGFPGTTTSVYTDTTAPLSLTAVPQAIATLKSGQFAAGEVYTINNVIAQGTSGVVTFTKIFEVSE